MSQSLRSVQSVIEKELKEFETRFREAMRSSAPLLDRITYYIVRRKGKQMRPMFVFLSAKICGGTSEATHTAASMVELLHTATLVHDDVVDEAYERRGFFSINALWKNKVAVLVGDFLFSQGLLLALRNQNYRFLHIISDAVKAMSEGELLQIEKARRLDITETVYFEIIRQKTASLIASACAAGAASATEDESIIARMHLFGEKTGIAFQIKDDLFDFGLDDVGKPLGIDIKEKKLTLPLIYALNHADRATRLKMLRFIRKYNEEPDKVRMVIDFVRASGGMEYAAKVMFQYRDEAFSILREFPESPARTALEELVVFVTERKK